MTERHAVQGMTERPAEQRQIKYRLVGSCRSVARSHPRSSPAASLNLPRLCGCLSRTCNEQRRRIAMVVTSKNRIVTTRIHWITTLFG
ncbi:hypothetical protein T07_11997 [Trichinella nelsoni]|uniref:Uncharacterized protein n=1 Tax=Trichinella nelsoni TaxID=6336 RepID=A0A0V0RWM6_9BILA|nr:hypothetical protein T07_11997 [Trichinella nelsoni]